MNTEQEITYKNLYDTIGSDSHIGSFYLREGSESSKKFGEVVTGTIFYSKEEREQLASGLLVNVKTEMVKIDSAMLDIDQIQREELKYGGIKTLDIKKAIYSHTWKQRNELHETGEKTIPNIIRLSYKSHPNEDVDLLVQGYLVSKWNNGDELPLFEKEKLAGITLGINNWSINKKIAHALGFDYESMQNNDRVLYYALQVRERRKIITEVEKTKFKRVKDNLYLKKWIGLVEEVAASREKVKDLERFNNAITAITESLKEFEPEILLHGKKQIYWDSNSYLHVVLRHIKKFQIGDFKERTPFPYKFEELRLLVERVLKRIEGEIERHFKENPGKPFSRVGTMSIFFNNDYYQVRIDGNGRLITIHPRGDGPKAH